MFNLSLMKALIASIVALSFRQSYGSRYLARSQDMIDELVDAGKRNILLMFNDPNCHGVPNINTLDEVSRKYENFMDFVTLTLPQADDIAKRYGVKSCNTFVYIPKDDPNATQVNKFTTSRPFADWMHNLMRTSVTFHNRLHEDISVFWITPDNEERRVSTMKARAMNNMGTFLGDTFVTRSVKDNSLVDTFMVMSPHEEFYVTPLVNACTGEGTLRTCPNQAAEKTKQDEQKQAQVERSREQSHAFRLEMNKKYPGVTKKYTPTGFEKRKMPQEVYDKLITFYHQNRDKERMEPWPADDTHVNHWDVNPTMIYLPERFKPDVYRLVQPLLEDWAQEKLEPTSFYGIRLYHNGSILENHVDRPSTHVISAIFNLDQKVDEDWPLEIYDHNGHMHHVIMEPGEMVLYESASCIHGRPIPFKGDYYANAFIHFRPTSGWSLSA